MRYLAWLIKLVLFLLLFAFAVKNTHMVSLSGLQGAQWQAPLILWLLGFFVLGAVAGVLAMLLPLRRAQLALQASQLKLQAAGQQQAADTPASRPEPAQPLDAVL